MATKDNIFKVIKWSAVAEWRFDVETPEVCAICKYKLTERCVQCAADNLERANCEISWGKCMHVYHRHCIQPWVVKNTKCPLDSDIWIEIRTEKM
jgi:anaphase-promoting complex subunit 11